MCRNGQYTERGIKARHGFSSERFRIEPEFAVKIEPELGDLGVLMEPTSIVAKAWDHIDRIGRRFNSWQPKKLLVTGSGSIGLLAALLGKQRGYEVHVLDRGRDLSKVAMIRIALAPAITRARSKNSASNPTSSSNAPERLR